MNHTTEILAYTKLASGQFAVLIRCCGDDQHTHWHTMAAEVVNDDARLQDSINKSRDIIANHHEAALQAESKLGKLIGKVKDH